MTSNKPLDGVIVVDCASLYAGPLVATMLGDFGAEVIKVEHPDSGDSLRQFGTYDEDLSWKWVGRNKKSVPLDLHDDEAREVFKELVADADVLIENFRPGTLERWGVGWETLSELNSGLVMLRITGFGQTGPYKDRPGFGTLVEAMSGFAYATGQEGGPPTLPPVALADGVCALHGTFATMMALYWRDIGGGTGQYIDASILESMFGLLGDHLIEHAEKGIDHERSGNRSGRTAPRNTYQTKDDRWVAISGSAESIAKRVLRIVGGEELASDPRFRTMRDRLEHVDELDALIAEWMSQHTRDEILEIFEKHEAAVGPVYNMTDILSDPHFDARDAILSVETDDGAVPMRGVFPKLSATPGSVEHPGPDLGEHARSVLTQRTSLTESEIHALAERGATSLGPQSDVTPDPVTEEADDD